jgi:uncharacterized protein (DUF2267 family)
MTTERIHVFDSAVQEANLWLKALMDRLVTDDPHFAYVALRSVLHALRDRVGPQNAAHLSAQLPMLIRGLFYEGWHAASTPTRERHYDDFIDHVRRDLPKDRGYDVDEMTRVVFGLLWERIDKGEIAKLVRIFPEELRDFWPSAARPQA